MVWADAICINQADDNEKANAVLQMHRIFGDARAVVASLGPNADNNWAVFGQLQTVARALSGPDEEASELGRRLLPVLAQAFWKELGQICTREWFLRLWTYQEAALAKSLWLCVGDRTVEWIDLESIMGIPGIGHPDPYQLLPFLSVMWARRSVKMGKSFSYDELVSQVWSRRATVALDYVYGLRSLADTQLEQNITVDYSDSTEQALCKLYVDACRSSFSQGSGIRVLELASKQIKRLNTMPSWCPDPRQDRLRLAVQRGLGQTSLQLRNGAGGPRNGQNYVPATLSEDGRRVRVKGFQLDIVRSVATNKLRGNDIMSDLSTLTRAQAVQNLQCLMEWQSLVHQTEPVASKEEIAPEYLHALFDITPEEQRGSHYTLGYQLMVDDLRGIAGEGQQIIDRRPYMNGIGSTLWKSCWTQCRDSIFFTTLGGRMGTGHPLTRNGDAVVILYGAPRPFLLRDLWKDGRLQHSLVGDAWVGGLMDLDTTSRDNPDIEDRIFTIG
jgi:hypothetical protein